jgi:Mn2+/Fe2+ NRAMP family transporter
MSDAPLAAEYDPYLLHKEAIQEPPRSLWTALRKIGPGIILAGSIVGSGELLLTTKLGADYGFVFLWLILFSCVIKVFVQTELGRYAISSGKPTLGALNELGGPRLGAQWMVWWWLAMMLLTIFQLGAMTGTVGQALNIAFPQVTESVANIFQSAAPALAETIRKRPELPWAVVTCATVIGLLYGGSYQRIEIVTTVLVVGLTMITVTAAMLLPATNYPIPWGEVGRGLTFSLPTAGIAVAFGVFGITGVGASELFYYPYWCLEKGYARYAGKREPGADWERRAKGWIRVMHLDAWVSMIVFTISTVAFYFMGATVLKEVLKEEDIMVEGSGMIETLSKMFVRPFGAWTKVVFLIGAGAVLFKTLYLSCAGNARLLADFLSLSGAVRYTQPIQRARVIHWLSLSIPVIALLLCFAFKDPAFMVGIGGFAQGLTLPIIAGATVYFRHKKLDRRLTPTPFLDIMLWVAFVSITVVACVAVGTQLMVWMTPQ